MYYLMFLFLGYVFLREYIENLTFYYTFIMDLFFIAILLYTKVEYSMGNDKSGYLFKKEIKLPWFLVISSFVFYVIYESLHNLYILNQTISNASFGDYMFLAEQILFTVIVILIYIKTFFGDVLELKLTHGYSFNIESFSEGDTSSSDKESKEKEDKEKLKKKSSTNEDVEIIREIEEEEKEFIKKIPVIVITTE